MRAFIIASAILAAAVSLSGCALYTVASTAVDVTSTVVSTTATVVGDVITAPFPSSDDSKKQKNSN